MNPRFYKSKFKITFPFINPLNVKGILLYFFIGLVMSGCAPGTTTQQAYRSHMLNVSSLENSNDRNIKTQIGIKNYAIQANYATHKNKGISASLFYTNSWKAWSTINPGYGIECAQIFFSNREKLSFELQIGGGFTNNNYRGDNSNNTFHTQINTIETRCKYFKIYTQPSLQLKSNKISIISTIKLSPIFFSNYYFYQELLWSEPNPNDEKSIPDFYYHYYYEETTRKNLFAFICEPAITIRSNGKVKYFAQLVGIITPKTIFKNAYDVYYHEFPTNASFIVNLGIEYNFLKNK